MLNGLSPELYKRLCNLLLLSGYFDSQKHPKLLFVDERLWDWRAIFPDTGGNPAIRVDQAIDFLYDQFDNATEKNGLVQFLNVLSEHFNPMDKLHVELKELAQELEQVINTVNNAPCPYRHLEPFLTEHAEFFYGRDESIKQLIDKVKNSPLTAVIGASGSGKSSLVKAGLVPKLHDINPNLWKEIIFTPKANPFEQLAIALDQANKSNKPKGTDTQDKTDDKINTNWMPLLQNPPNDLSDTISKNLGHQPILIIADQFEELYSSLNKEYQIPFMNLLVHIHKHQPTSELPIKMVLTLRADFFEQAINYPTFADVLKGHLVTISAMKNDELKLAIEEPANKQGVKFQEGLVGIIADEVGQEPGQLPLLEFALFKLWQQRKGRLITHVDYDKLGGVKRAFNNYAEKIVNELDGKKEQVRHIFTQLVKQEEGMPLTRQAVPQTQLEEYWDVVTELAKSYLIVINKVKQDNDEIVVVELAHEWLIRYWKTLGDWITEDKKFRSWQGKLNAPMRLWQRHPNNPDTLLRGPQLNEIEIKWHEYSYRLTKDERTFIKKSIDYRQNQHALWRSRLAIGIAGLVIITLILAGLAYTRQQALTESKEAQAKTAIALSENKTAQIAVLEELALTKATVNINPPKDIPMLLCLEALRMRNEPDISKPIAQSCFPKILLTFFTQPTTTSLSSDSKPSTFAIDPTGQYVALGYKDKHVTMWDVNQQPPKQIPELNNLTKEAKQLRFDPLGQRLVVNDWDNTVTVWGFTATKMITQFKPVEPTIVEMAFDGDKLALGDETGRLTLLLSQFKSPLSEDEHKDHTIETLLFSPDNHWLVTGDNPEAGQSVTGDNSEAGSLVLWDVHGKALVPIKELRLDHEIVAFSRDSRFFAAADKIHHNIQLYSIDKLLNLSPVDTTAEGELNRPLIFHQDTVRLLVFHPNGSWLASYSKDDGALVLWDIKNGRLIKQAQLPRRTFLKAMQFSADGTQLLAVDEQAILFTWNLDSTDWEQMGCRQQAKRNFSLTEWQEYWPQGLTEQSYHLTCPEFTIEQDVVAVIEAGNEAAYNQAITPTLALSNARLAGYVCDFGSYRRYQAAASFCDRIVDLFPNQPILLSSRAVARVIFNQLDQTVIDDLGIAISKFSEDKRPDCAKNRKAWLFRLNELVPQAQLPDEEKEKFIADMAHENDCGVLAPN